MSKTMKALMTLVVGAALLSATIMAKGHDSPSGLTASVLVDTGSETANKNEETPKFILTNAGKVPVKICSTHSILRDETSSKISVRITSEHWISDAPTEEDLKQTIKVLRPGMSFAINLPAGLSGSKKEVEITYGVSEKLAKKIDIWQGELSLNLGSGLHDFSKSIMAKGQDSPSELTASVLVEPGIGAANKNKKPPKFILTNTGKTPVRICGFHQIWWHESPSKILLIITSESFKSDAPSEQHLEQSIKILEPGMSFPIDLRPGLSDSKKDVEITYEVSEKHAKKFNIWQGRLQLNLGSDLHESSK
jgi:hypothetical protein